MPDKPAKIESIADTAAWVHEHDGRINAWWSQQHKLNDDSRAAFSRFGLRLDGLAKRIGACERKMLYVAGVASWGGAIVGALIGAWIKSAVGG